MTSTSFRDSMNSLGWSRRVPEVPANTSSSTPILSKLSSFNPFKSGGYVQLPTHEAPGAPLPAPSRREEEEGWFACKLCFENFEALAYGCASRQQNNSLSHCSQQTKINPLFDVI
jgi:hypothetical protein